MPLNAFSAIPNQPLLQSKSTLLDDNAPNSPWSNENEAFPGSSQNRRAKVLRHGNQDNVPVIRSAEYDFDTDKNQKPRHRSYGNILNDRSGQSLFIEKNSLSNAKSPNGYNSSGYYDENDRKKEAQDISENMKHAEALTNKKTELSFENPNFSASRTPNLRPYYDNDRKHGITGIKSYPTKYEPAGKSDIEVHGKSFPKFDNRGFNMNHPSAQHQVDTSNVTLNSDSSRKTSSVYLPSSHELSPSIGLRAKHVVTYPRDEVVQLTESDVHVDRSTDKVNSQTSNTDAKANVKSVAPVLSGQSNGKRRSSNSNNLRPSGSFNTQFVSTSLKSTMPSNQERDEIYPQSNVHSPDHSVAGVDIRQAKAEASTITLPSSTNNPPRDVSTLPSSTNNPPRDVSSFHREPLQMKGSTWSSQSSQRLGKDSSSTQSDDDAISGSISSYGSRSLTLPYVKPVGSENNPSAVFEDGSSFPYSSNPQELEQTQQNEREMEYDVDKNGMEPSDYSDDSPKASMATQVQQGKFRKLSSGANPAGRMSAYDSQDISTDEEEILSNNGYLGLNNDNSSVTDTQNSDYEGKQAKQLRRPDVVIENSGSDKDLSEDSPPGVYDVPGRRYDPVSSVAKSSTNSDKADIPNPTYSRPKGSFVDPLRDPKSPFSKRTDQFESNPGYVGVSLFGEDLDSPVNAVGGAKQQEVDDVDRSVDEIFPGFSEFEKSGALTDNSALNKVGQNDIFSLFKKPSNNIESRVDFGTQRYLQRHPRNRGLNALYTQAGPPGYEPLQRNSVNYDFNTALQSSPVTSNFLLRKNYENRPMPGASVDRSVSDDVTNNEYNNFHPVDMKTSKSDNYGLSRLHSNEGVKTVPQTFAARSVIGDDTTVFTQSASRTRPNPAMGASIFDPMPRVNDGFQSSNTNLDDRTDFGFGSPLTHGGFGFPGSFANDFKDERSDNSIFSDHLFTEQDDRGDPPEDGNVEGDDQLSDHLFDDAKTSSTVSETSSNTDSNPDGHESDSDTIRRDDHNIFPQREPYEINPEVSYDLNHHEADPDLYSDQRGQEGDPSVSDEEKQANTDSFNERNAGTDHAVNAVDPSARNGRYAEPTPPPDNDEGNSAAAEDAEKNYKLLSEQPTNQNEGYPPSQLTKK